MQLVSGATRVIASPTSEQLYGKTFDVCVDATGNDKVFCNNDYDLGDNGCDCGIGDIRDDVDEALDQYGTSDIGDYDTDDDGDKYMLLPMPMIMVMMMMKKMTTMMMMIIRMIIQ
jgi:hypothetical protein